MFCRFKIYIPVWRLSASGKKTGLISDYLTGIREKITEPWQVCSGIAAGI